MDHLIAIFCDLDDFCKTFEPASHRRLLHERHRHRTRSTTLALREILTLLVYFHCSPYRTFTHDYTEHVALYLRPYCPHLVSYQRFVELLPRALLPLCHSLGTRKGRCTGMACIDSTPLAVCAPHQMATHKVCAGLAARGKTSMGWFYRFKLHRIINDEGELLALQVTPGTIHDRRPVAHLATGLTGQLFGDRGSLSQDLHDTLLRHGLELLTTIRKHMQNRLLRLWDKLLLRKRSLMETVNAQLTNMGIYTKRDRVQSIAYSEELISATNAATLPSTDRHHGIVDHTRAYLPRDS